MADKTSFYKQLSQNLENDEIDKIYKEMSKSIFLPEVLEKTKPVKNSIEVIKKLSHKFDIYIITARTEQMIEPVKKWLKKYNINKNIKETISSSYENKQDICIENDICFLCDDDLRHIIDKKVKTRVLFNNQNLLQDNNYFVTESWNEIERILLELYL